MTTNFFQNIASLQLPGTWKLVIQTDAEGNMTVSELFNATCGDKAASKMEQDKKIKEKAQAATAPKNTADAEIPATPQVSKEDKKKAYDEAIEKVNELTQKLKFSEALTFLPDVAEHSNKENELKKKRQFLEQQANFYEKALQNFNA